MEQLEFEEVEYKFRADGISLSDFRALMLSHPEGQDEDFQLDAASWDIYFDRKGEVSQFTRLRLGKTPELTKKAKTVNGTNWHRVEIDLPLAGDSDAYLVKTVSRFLELDGYKENFRVYKVCSIYWFTNVNYVYYIVLNKDLEEIGRFIEVEVNKSLDLLKITRGDKDRHQVLDEAVEFLSPLGIKKANRMKKSLYELYRT